MIASMTGFTRKRFTNNGVLFVVEIRTLNHKYLDIHCKLPDGLAVLEMPLRNLLKKHLSRGRVDVRIGMEPGSEASLLQLNRHAFQAYRKIIADLSAELSLKSVDPVAMLSLPNVLLCNDLDPDIIADSFWPPLELALEQLAQDRRREGALLWQDILDKLARIQELLNQLQSLTQQQQDEVGERFRQRLARLDENLDDNRIFTEIAILVDKSDINEELVRLQAHLGEFARSGGKSEPVGRRLEFLGQEMLREVNTIAAKSAIYPISKIAVDIKSELEKIREQIQNIE